MCLDIVWQKWIPVFIEFQFWATSGYENNLLAIIHQVMKADTAGKHSLKRGKFYAIEKNFYYRTVKSLRTGRSCGKIDAGVFK